VVGRFTAPRQAPRMIKVRTINPNTNDLTEPRP